MSFAWAFRGQGVDPLRYEPFRIRSGIDLQARPVWLLGDPGPGPRPGSQKASSVSEKLTPATRPPAPSRH